MLFLEALKEKIGFDIPEILGEFKKFGMIVENEHDEVPYVQSLGGWRSCAEMSYKEDVADLRMEANDLHSANDSETEEAPSAWVCVTQKENQDRLFSPGTATSAQARLVVSPVDANSMPPDEVAEEEEPASDLLSL